MAESSDVTETDVVNYTQYNLLREDCTGVTLTAHGDIVFRDATGLKRLAAGTPGQFLKTNGAGFDPSWAAPA